MTKFRCTVCNYIYDEEKEEVQFSNLPASWTCPVCNSPLKVFVVLKVDLQTSKKSAEKITVSDIIIKQMAEWGVKYVFGIPGTSSLGILEALRNQDHITYFQVRHEQTAAFMASAYGKLTGNISACLTVAGPGATNLTTGLYDAKLDKSPVLALTGQVTRELIGPGSFQEIDQHSFFEPFSVFNQSLMFQDQTTNLVTLAIKNALLKKGVSHISVPNDIQKEVYDTEIMPLEGKITNMAISAPDYLIKKSAKIINSADRPVIIAGFGAMDQGLNLLELAEKISSPIVTTFRGKGVINEDEKLYVGSHGTIGSTAATSLVRKSDLLIVIGSSFSDMTQIPEKKTIQIDIDPLMIGRRYPVEVGLLGNSAEILPELIKNVKKVKRDSYRDEIQDLKNDWENIIEREVNDKKSPLRVPYILKVLQEMADPEAIFALDVGENSWWFGRNFLVKNSQKIVFSGHLASMGFGLPAALAAQIEYPEKQVICITGDGGFSMVMADFLTAVKYQLPLTVLLFNNHQLAMIQQEQKIEKYPNWQTELFNCDFAAFAKNCGGIGIKVTESEELSAAIEKALSLNKPVLVDIETDPRRFH